MSEADGDWSVVTPKKDKKTSPKAQKRKSLKRTDLQRSSSSNQVSTRRKLVNESGTPRITRSMKNKITNDVSTESSAVLTESNESTEGNNKLNKSLEEVSSKIQFLSIQEQPQEKGSEEALFSSKFKSDSSQIDNIITPEVFCEDCRSFDVNTTTVSGQFQTRLE